MPGAHSAAVGFWVGVGSRDETPSLAGASHYLEHLLFKGTRTRSALDIASVIDGVGGEMNAFTAKEHTCYYAHVLASDLPMAIDVVGDVVLNATLTTADLESERSVVLEEIAMRDDDPGDAVHDLLGETLFGSHPLGRPVIGSIERIENLTRTQIAGYYRRRYVPDNMVISVAGRIDHAEIVDRVRKVFGDRLGKERTPIAPRGRAAVEPVLSGPARRVGVINRKTEQAHVVLGSLGLTRFDERRFTLGVLNAALGGGMSSRLFQEIREKRGLAYTAYSFSTLYASEGQFGVYAGCQPKKAKQVLSIMREQLADVAANGLTQTEIDRGIGQVRGSTVLALEDVGSRMTRIGKSELSYGDHVDVDWLIERVSSVTRDEVAELAADLLSREQCLAIVGPFGEHDFDAVMS